MVSRFLRRGGGGMWLINQLLQETLSQMEDTAGNPVFHGSKAEGMPDMLHGKPIRWYEHASAVGTHGDIALVKPSPYYVIKNGSGPFMDVGTINTDFISRQRRLMLFLANDGRPWLEDKFKLQNDTEVSPFVTLDTFSA